MTERSLGEKNNFFFAKVVSNKDEKQSGRLQIRVFGIQDDETNIPDEKLLWATSLQPVTSAAHKQIGSSPVGAKEGTVIMGMWADKDKTIPVVLGTMASAGQPQANSTVTVNGQPPLDANKNDLPHNARDSRAAGRDFNPVLANNHVTHAMTGMTGNTQASVGTNTGSDIVAHAHRIDPQNNSGVIPNSTQNMTKLLSLANNISRISGMNPAAIPTFLMNIAGQALNNNAGNISSFNMNNLRTSASTISSAIAGRINTASAFPQYSVPYAVTSSTSGLGLSGFQSNMMITGIMNNIQEFLKDPLKVFNNILDSISSVIKNIVDSIGFVLTDIMNFMNNIVGSFNNSNQNVARVPDSSETSIRNTIQETQRRVVSCNIIGDQSREIFNVP